MRTCWKRYGAKSASSAGRGRGRLRLFARKIRIGAICSTRSSNKPQAIRPHGSRVALRAPGMTCWGECGRGDGLRGVEARAPLRFRAPGGGVGPVGLEAEDADARRQGRVEHVVVPVGRLEEVVRFRQLGYGAGNAVGLGVLLELEHAAAEMQERHGQLRGRAEQGRQLVAEV